MACQSSTPPPETVTPDEEPKNQATNSSNITIIKNTRIYTVNPNQPMVDALAFNAQGTILATGTQTQLTEDYPSATHIDLHGKGAIVPGLIDAHAHLMNLGYSLITANLSGTQSKADILKRLKSKADELPSSAWLIGRGWDQNDWPGNNGLFPSAADLDTAFPDRPVWLTRVDGHAGWANSAALQQLDPQQLITDPAGGRIMRNNDGLASGVFVDGAMALINALVPPPSLQTKQLALQQALAETSRFGLTGLHEAGTSLQNLQLYQDQIQQQQFPLRLYAMVDGQNDAYHYLCKEGLLDDPSGRLDARAIKFYLDGALGSRGAALVDDYTDEAGNQGLLFVEETPFAEQVAAAMGCGLQVNTHAIGDRANQTLINAYEVAMQNTPNHNGRHRIEHAQVLLENDFQRSAELQLIASVQPTHATSDMYWAEQRVGEQRILRAYAWQDFIDVDVPLALGSDAPVESANPLLGFYAAISRQDDKDWPEGGWYPQQRLSREQALHGFTLGAAYAAFMEQEVGSLEPGKRADFVWLSDDIMQIPAKDILSTTVLQTWLDGENIYSHSIN